eukprot:GGOE01058860.1.p1 GENE.GGOE01058860.1~~GGOE01058860.1.p1  ORF type:complete len:753 (-),score=263.05 GGOE01058860.1:2131-4263(-)
MTTQQTEAEQQLHAKETELQALQQATRQLQAQVTEGAQNTAMLEANLESAAHQAEAAQRQCAEAQAQVKETRTQLEDRLVAERVTLQGLRGLSLGGALASSRLVPTVQEVEQAELLLVAGWHSIVDDLQEHQVRLARQEQELRQSCQEQRQAREEATRHLQQEVLRATACEAALQGGMEEKARLVLLTQQECREAQQREWGAQQQLTLRMAAEWKVLEQLRSPTVMEAAAAGAGQGSDSGLTVDRLEAAEVQLVSTWQRMQADLAQCRQRLAAEWEHMAETQCLGPEVAWLTMEHSELVAQVADLQLQLEETTEHCTVLERQRQEWESNAKEMARQLQERMVAEGRVLMALQCASSGLVKSSIATGSEVDRAVQVVSALGADRLRLQKHLDEAEDELAQCRRWLGGSCFQEGSVSPSPLKGAGELALGLQEVMTELEVRMAAVAGKGKALATDLGSAPGAEDVLVMCERIMCRARGVLTAVSEQRLPSPGPSDTTGPPLEEVLQQLQGEDRAQWAAQRQPQERVDPTVIQQLIHLQPDRLIALVDSCPEGTHYLLQVLVEEYTRMLQDTAENRREWRALYDGLSLTMQAVSGRPRFPLFQFGPTSAEALKEALRRQEELNARAAAWLMGLYTQRDVLKQNVLAQLRVNGRIAQERSALQAELKDVSGKLQRAMAVVRRLHTEQDALLQTPRSPFPAPLEATTTMQSLSCQ